MYPRLAADESYMHLTNNIDDIRAVKTICMKIGKKIMNALNKLQ